MTDVDLYDRMRTIALEASRRFLAELALEEGPEKSGTVAVWLHAEIADVVDKMPRTSRYPDGFYAVDVLADELYQSVGGCWKRIVGFDMQSKDWMTD